MSVENVEIVRRGYEALNQGDLEGAVANFAPDFEWVPSGAIPDMQGVFRGSEEYRQQIMEQFGDEFDGFGADVHEIRDAGDQVLVSLTLRGRGKQSGVETKWNFWHTWTMRNGSVVHGKGFTSRAEALEAVGLPE